MFLENNQKIYKNLIPVIGVLLCLLLTVLIVSGAVGIQNKIKEGKYTGQGLVNKNTISVSGEGKIFVKPDIGLVSISVVSESKKVAEAQQENAQKMNNIINFLKNELGILEKDLKTTNYAISPQYEYPDGQRVFLGYEVRQTLEVKIRDLSKVGEVLEKAASKGANKISSLQFTVDNSEKPKSEARKLAIDNAGEKAKALSVQLGVKLGKIVNFNENLYNPVPTPYPFLKEAVGLGGGETAPQIETGENEINAYVNITYEIE